MNQVRIMSSSSLTLVLGYVRIRAINHLPNILSMPPEMPGQELYPKIEILQMSPEQLYRMVRYGSSEEKPEVIARMESFSEDEQRELLTYVVRSDSVFNLREVLSGFTKVSEEEIVNALLNPGSPQNDEHDAREAQRRSQGVLREDLDMFGSISPDSARALIAAGCEWELLEHGKLLQGVSDQELVDMILGTERISALLTYLPVLKNLSAETAKHFIQMGAFTEVFNDRSSFVGLTDEGIIEACEKNKESMRLMMVMRDQLPDALRVRAEAEVEKLYPQVSPEEAERKLVEAIFGTQESE
jgi:hypothetical protein